jgi:hypothetical protein
MKGFVLGALFVRTLNAQIIDTAAFAAPDLASITASESATLASEASPLVLFDEPTSAPELDSAATTTDEADLLVSASASATAGADADTLTTDTPVFDVLATASESGAIPIIAITGGAAIVTPVPVGTGDEATTTEQTPSESDTTSLPGFDFSEPNSTTPLGGASPFDVDATALSEVPTSSVNADPVLFGTADVILSTLETSTTTAVGAGAFLFGTQDVILSTLQPSSNAAVDDGVWFGSTSTTSAAGFDDFLGPTSTPVAGGGFGSFPTFEPPVGPGTVFNDIPTASGLGGFAAPTSMSSFLAIPTGKTGGRFGTPATGTAGGSFGVPPQPGMNGPGVFPGPGIPVPLGKAKAKAKGVGGLSVGGSVSGKKASGSSSGNPSSGKGFGGLSVGGPGGGVNGLGYVPGAEPPLAKRPGPPGWDGDDNGEYDGEDYDTGASWKKGGKHVGKKGKGWHDSDSDDDCPRWCREADTDSDSSDDEAHTHGKRKKKVAKKTQVTRRSTENGVYRAPQPPSVGGLPGFSWPGKKSIGKCCSLFAIHALLEPIFLHPVPF